jgi:hypothetical protein
MSVLWQKRMNSRQKPQRNDLHNVGVMHIFLVPSSCPFQTVLHVRRSLSCSGGLSVSLVFSHARRLRCAFQVLLNNACMTCFSFFLFFLLSFRISDFSENTHRLLWV